MNLPLIVKKGESRVDSRLIAKSLDNQHKATVQLIERYAGPLADFGKLPFEMEALPSGQRTRYYLLNENQAFFLLTLSRNTPRVVRLKALLVQAFSEARKAAELHQEYLPTYHAMHDQLARLGDGTGNDRFLHMNVNKLVNEAAHIKAGQRSTVPVPQKAMVIAAQHIASEAMQGATDGKQAYAKAKDALTPFLPHKRIGG